MAMKFQPGDKVQLFIRSEMYDANGWECLKCWNGFICEVIQADGDMLKLKCLPGTKRPDGNDYQGWFWDADGTHNYAVLYTENTTAEEPPSLPVDERLRELVGELLG